MTISTSIQLTSVFRRKEKLIQFLDFFLQLLLCACFTASKFPFKEGLPQSLIPCRERPNHYLRLAANLTNYNCRSPSKFHGTCSGSSAYVAEAHSCVAWLVGKPYVLFSSAGTRSQNEI